MIKVKDINHRDTAYTRAFTITHNGKDYSGWLFWNENEGTWIDWEDVVEPKWVENWEGEDELITLIENLTDEKLMEREEE